MYEFKLPDLGEGIPEGEILKWYVKEGDAIAEDAPLVDVETDKGPASFLMRWQHDRAVDYGQQGKILLDVDDNRYLVPDVEALPEHERNDFERYIYW